MALAVADPRAPVSNTDISSRPSASTYAGGHAVRTSSSKQNKKKKVSAVRRYLTLKEPSQSAFEKLSAHQVKDGTSPGAGSYGISRQQLPTTVPSVNSKWDGIPGSLGSSDRVPGSSGSVFTQILPKFGVKVNAGRSTWSRSTGDRHAPPDSLAPSSAPGSKLHKGASLVTNHTMSSLPEMSYFFPDPPGSSGNPALAEAPLHGRHVDGR